MESLKATLAKLTTIRPTTTPDGYPVCIIPPERPVVDVCFVCRGTGLRIVKASDDLDAELVQVGCTCQAGESYRRMSSRQIAAAENVRRFFRQPKWARYADATLADFAGENAEAVTRVKAALLEQRGLYLWGQAGRGKTRMAAAVLRLCAERGYLIAGVYVPDWLETIKSAFGHQRQAEQGEAPRGWLSPEQVIRQADACQAVVLDDLGAEHLTSWVAARLDALLDRRWSSSPATVTIITSNLRLSGLGDRFDSLPELAETGPRLVSRIAGMCRTVQLVGPDRRLE